MVMLIKLTTLSAPTNNQFSCNTPVCYNTEQQQHGSIFMPLILLFFTLFSSMAISDSLYNGETTAFGGSAAWDNNGSTLSEVSIAPLSPSNHLRATLANKSWWGASGYVISHWGAIDFSGYKTITLAIKSDTANHALGIQLFDSAQNTSTAIKIDPSQSYDQFTIPLSAFEGVDMAKITVIVFSVSRKDPGTYVIDIDDITLEKEVLPPDES
jgi:hypothetical protein